ncbi:hypothetical protein DPMN_184044 [Dreissena polymorpha]|uniref:Uncharacterized protein n=1 Tax=Dreissena polymorpha TaxID=45954 RepID=A0A9D4I463_DREPO|nr:hypothetical protein DPMN_184044 [Dreissena polymorpha]
MTWMQIAKQKGQTWGSWRDSPTTKVPGGICLTAYVPDGTKGENDEMIQQCCLAIVFLP